jgi:hemolysin activation/secretion protein
MKRFLFASMACAVLCVATDALAQTGGYIIEQQQKQEAEPATRGTTTYQQGKSVLEVQNIQPFVLKSVAVAGTSVEPQIVAAAVRPFIGQTLDAAGVKRVADALSDTYGATSDIALFNVVVPAQDFASGTLHLIVVEGYFESVDIEGGNGADTALVQSYANRLVHERPLTTKTYERIVTLIRQIPGLTSDFRTTAGDQRGALKLTITLDQKIASAVLSVNNRGTALLGRTEMMAQASILSPFREGEQYSVTFATPTSTGRFRYVGVGVGEPLDDDGTEAALSFGYLRTKPEMFVQPGEAGTLGLTISHPIVLGLTQSWLVDGTFDMLNSTNALFGSQAATERVRVLRAGSTYNLATATSAISVNLNASFGLDGLGAHVANPATENSGFQKLDARLVYTQMLADDWVLRFHGAGQYGMERLPVSELYPLGGSDFGRAFESAAISGDQALAGSLEIAWRPMPPPEMTFLAGPEIYGFADGGETWSLARGTTPASSDELGSVGLGVRSSFFNRLSGELELGRQLDTIPIIAPHPAWVVDFSVTLVGY